MNTELPIVSVAGDEFYLDSTGLRRTAEPESEIPFDRMERSVLKALDAPVRRFMYDTAGKCLADLKEYGDKVPETIKYMEIPEKFILAAATKDELPDILNSLTRNGWKLYEQGYDLAARELPRVKLMGTDFILDTLNGELVEMPNMENRIVRRYPHL